MNTFRPEIRRFVTIRERRFWNSLPMGDLDSKQTSFLMEFDKFLNRMI